MKIKKLEIPEKINKIEMEIENEAINLKDLNEQEMWIRKKNKERIEKEEENKKLEEEFFRYIYEDDSLYW